MKDQLEIMMLSFKIILLSLINKVKTKEFVNELSFEGKIDI